MGLIGCRNNFWAFLVSYQLMLITFIQSWEILPRIFKRDDYLSKPHLGCWVIFLKTMYQATLFQVSDAVLFSDLLPKISQLQAIVKNLCHFLSISLSKHDLCSPCGEETTAGDRLQARLAEATLFGLLCRLVSIQVLAEGLDETDFDSFIEVCRHILSHMAESDSGTLTPLK